MIVLHEVCACGHGRDTHTDNGTGLCWSCRDKYDGVPGGGCDSFELVDAAASDDPPPLDIPRPLYIAAVCLAIVFGSGGVVWLLGAATFLADSVMSSAWLAQSLTVTWGTLLAVAAIGAALYQLLRMSCSLLLERIQSFRYRYRLTSGAVLRMPQAPDPEVQTEVQSEN